MFTDEQQAAIDALLAKQAKDIESKLRSEFDESVKGLKSTNEALKAEKLAEKEAREAAELEAAKKAEDWEKVHKLETEKLAQERDSLADQINQRDSLIVGKEKQLAVSGVLGHLVKNDAGMRLMMSNLVDTNLIDGQVVTNYKDFDGNVVANSADDFVKWGQGNDVMRGYFKGSSASGGDASGSKSSDALQAQNTNTKAAEAKQRGDLKGFLDASIKLN